MKDFSRSSLAYSSVTAMSKSNPTAINGMFQAANVEAFLKNHPHPEATRKVLVDPYLQFEPPNPSKVNASNDTSSSLSNSHRWSDYTLTGSISGRCSAYSWGQDEAELDRAATESVRRKFNKIDAALFEGRSTGTARVDDECKEWRNNFPHLEVRGIHLLDSMEDGTEMVSPDPFLSLNAHTVEDLESHGCSSKLMILGQKIQPLVLQDLDETSPLYEEVIAAEGTLEEFFAFDNCTEEVQVNASRKNSRLKRHHGLPPVTPNACLREAVMSLASNHLWNEVIGVLQPLVAAVRENSQGRNSAYSLVDNALTPIASALGEGSPQEQPYILRGLRDPPTLTKASGQSGSKFLRLKHSYPPSSQAGGIPSTFPQLTNLSGVMQIRSLSLQQRAHSSYVPK